MPGFALNASAPALRSLSSAPGAAGRISSSLAALQIAQAKRQGVLPKNAAVNPKAWSTAQGLEANFFQTMVGAMFEGVKGDGPMGGEGSGQEAWRSMMIENFGQSLAAKGGVGLTPAIYREMLRMQESKAL